MIQETNIEKRKLLPKINNKELNTYLLSNLDKSFFIETEKGFNIKEDKAVFYLKLKAENETHFKRFTYTEEEVLQKDKISILLFKVNMQKLERLNAYLNKLKYRKAPQKYIQEAIREQESIFLKDI